MQYLIGPILMTEYIIPQKVSNHLNLTDWLEK